MAQESLCKCMCKSDDFAGHWRKAGLLLVEFGGGPHSDYGCCIYYESFKGCDWHETGRLSTWAVNGKSLLESTKHQLLKHVLCSYLPELWDALQLMDAGTAPTSLRVFSTDSIWCSQLFCAWYCAAVRTSRHLWNCNLACKWRFLL